ncbi:hypothetical protein WQQ_07220 [Hydrocarboniphaga effusa AP103]|uniref:Uncharacterized protein n=1 Tax=Hydrocarboniphaga effusa AP103 TaxID=1172194 RepID=I8TA84_9GAMM|nr:hypothetical protein WQQ_07220 [Hydrocarboniphaga effusa AP103]
MPGGLEGSKFGHGCSWFTRTARRSPRSRLPHRRAAGAAIQAPRRGRSASPD